MIFIFLASSRGLTDPSNCRYIHRSDPRESSSSFSAQFCSQKNSPHVAVLRLHHESSLRQRSGSGARQFCHLSGSCPEISVGNCLFWLSIPTVNSFLIHTSSFRFLGLAMLRLTAGKWAQSSCYTATGKMPNSFLSAPKTPRQVLHYQCCTLNVNVVLALYFLHEVKLCYVNET